MTAMDNRGVLARLGLTGTENNLASILGYGSAHYVLKVGETRLVYCYIRKNACSAFKQLFVSHSHERWDREAMPNILTFMNKNHRLKRVRDIVATDRVVFVYRDPIERILSVFRNKFIQQSGAAGICNSVAKRLSMDDVGTFTFEQFCLNYLRIPFRRLNQHVLPQARHLMRIRYTDAIPLDQLQSRMGQIIGEDRAAEVFLTRRNTTKGRFTNIDGAHRLPIRELTRLYVSEGVMPDDRSLLVESMQKVLEKRYAEDIRLLRRLSGNGQTHSGGAAATLG